MPSSSWLLVSVVIFLTILNPAESEPRTDSFIYGGCSQAKYSPNSVYESNINSLLTSLVNSATYSTYNNFTIMGSSSQDTAYGLYQCRGDLSMPDCTNCVARAVSQIGTLCGNAYGGALELQGCFVKYDNNKFLGVEDKTVVLKKCGPAMGYDTELLERRDALLAGLGSGGGPYRVGGSGKIQGMAQCVGDLSLSECQDCLGSAIQELKSNCGTAVSGDMFLAKCYVRYAAGGVDDQYRGGGGGRGGFSSSSGGSGRSSSDDAEKALAITVGLLAGVAVLIVFAAFLRKAFGGKGK
ncbi:hypothetical protein MKW94_030469 [Papaver nudicaule]|uniref:Gnk2-homologous domain-containing protein n=1 Tax=Papaver nudicaule TaxID=74823 RepID=A0AA41RWE0_PAPNU|nr:hypothetical protein [Papaver nudicaule]